MPPPPAPRLRHPVVLAHGLLGFTRWALGDATVAAYFRGIPDLLAGGGNRVIVPELPPTGSVARRADALATAIRREAGRERVHVVAHSMGGLDARHAITRLGLGDQVVSLTTLGTPHRGSPVADRGTALASKVGLLDVLRRLGLETAAYEDLRTDACAAFNATTPDDPRVVYRSFAGRKPRASMTPALRTTHDVVAAADGDNDGLVSVASARWGSASEVVDADHVDLVGWTPPVAGPLGRPIDVAALWARIAAGLADAEARGAAGSPPAPGVERS
jgi:triacylglycerol lipase